MFFPCYITQGHWCMVLFEFCIMWEVWGRVSGSVLNFTGLRNSRFTGNTDHLAHPEFGELSPDLLTTSLGPLNRWDCQGERAVPEGGFAVIDQWNSDSASPVCLCEFTCACSFSVLTLTVCACCAYMYDACSACVKSLSSPEVHESSDLMIKAVPSELCHKRCLHQIPSWWQQCKKGGLFHQLEHLCSVCLTREK